MQNDHANRTIFLSVPARKRDYSIFPELLIMSVAIAGAMLSLVWIVQQMMLDMALK